MNKLIDSIVYYSIPCIKSTTNTAKSAILLPLLRNEANDSWPGVSINSKPGQSWTTLSAYGKFLIFSVIYSSVKNEAPIY